jgi:hypothetical protein
MIERMLTNKHISINQIAIRIFLIIFFSLFLKLSIIIMLLIETWMQRLSTIFLFTTKFTTFTLSFDSWNSSFFDEIFIDFFEKSTFSKLDVLLSTESTIRFFVVMFSLAWWWFNCCFENNYLNNVFVFAINFIFQEYLSNLLLKFRMCEFE